MTGTFHKLEIARAELLTVMEEQATWFEGCEIKIGTRTFWAWPEADHCFSWHAHEVGKAHSEVEAETLDEILKLLIIRSSSEGPY